MPPPENQRRFTRFQLDATVHIRHGHEHWEACLVDISLNGALLTIPNGWNGSEGEPVSLEIHIADSEMVIRMEAEIAHQGHGHVGFHCRRIDLDSIEHLRRLVELNLGDPARLNRELHALGSQKPFGTTSH
ncbi:MAG: PilZ domain-containing protein [Acidiferrobacterales bacterium]